MAKSQLDIILKVTDKASKEIGQVEGSLGKLGKIAGLGLAAAAAGITAIGAAAISLAKDSAHIPGITAAFEGLTQGIDGGSGKMLSALRDASQGMVSNTELMRQFNLANQLVGDDFAQKLPDAMQYLGKVSAATGEDMGYLMDSLIRGVGRLSPMILDNLGIQVDLNDAYEAYAESVGKSTEELTKAEQQAAVMDAVMAQLATNTENLPDVTGTAAQQFATFQTSIQNAKDAIGVAMLPALQDLVTKLTPIIEEYGPKIAAWLSENLPKAIDTAVEFFNTKLIPAIKWISDGLGAWPGIIENIKTAWQKIKTWAMQYIQPVVDMLAPFLPGSPTPLEKGLKQIGRAMVEFTPQAQALNQDARSFFQGGTVNINNGTGMDAFESMLRGLT